LKLPLGEKATTTRKAPAGRPPALGENVAVEAKVCSRRRAEPPSGCSGSAADCATTLPPESTSWNCTVPSARARAAC